MRIGVRNEIERDVLMGSKRNARVSAIKPDEQAVLATPVAFYVRQLRAGSDPWMPVALHNDTSGTNVRCPRRPLRYYILQLVQS